MAERIDVMISSTARDLPRYRQEAKDACVRQGMFPIMMEDLPAMDADAIGASMAMVDEAEIYLGIVARRYGYVPKNHDISITEMEYNRAVERGIPRLIFMMDDAYDAPDLLSDADNPLQRAKLAAFKERLKTDQVVGFFTSPADLRAQIIGALARIAKRVTGSLHRPSFIPLPPEPYVAHPYTLLESGNVVGRTAEIDLLNQWLAAPTSEIHTARILNIVAIGGMGKSSLTWKWFNDIAPQEAPLAGRLWWSFYESDAHYENFVTRALAYVSGQSEDDIQKKRLHQREEELLGILDQQPFLLVLDGLERLLIAYSKPEIIQQYEAHLETNRQADRANNVVASILGLQNFSANPPEQQNRLRKTADPRAGAFLRKLTKLRGGRILVSTRLFPADLETSAGVEMPGSKALLLKGLADGDALHLWRSLGVGGSDDALTELFHAFDNYPLLIRTLAGEVARFRRSPGDFDAWRKANTGFNPYGLPLVQRQSHVLQYALEGIDDAKIQVLRTIAAFNSPATYNAIADLLVAKDDIPANPNRPFDDETALDDALTELENRGLLGWDRAANRYDLHPVVRGVVWSNLNKDARHDIYAKMHEHFKAMPTPKNWRKVQSKADLSATIELYNTLIGLERYDEAADVLNNRLYRPLRLRLSDGQRLADLLEQLFPDGEDLPKVKDAPTQAWVLNALAQAYQMIGEPGRAVPLFERSNELKTRHHYTLDLSTGFRDLAYAQRLVGGLRYSEAAARSALLHDRSDGNRLLEAISLQVLGLALAARGQFEDSARALDRSLDLADRTDANRAYNHQAMRALWVGDHSAAFDWAEKGIAYAIQRKLEAGLILAHRLQGEAALGLHNLPLAEERLLFALTQAREVNLKEEEIAALVALAELHRMRKDYTIARERLADVWEDVENAPYRLFHADACHVLAYIERETENPDAAKVAALKCYELAWCDGEPYAYHRGLMNARMHLGVLGVPEPDLPPFDVDSTMPMVYIEIDPPQEPEF